MQRKELSRFKNMVAVVFADGKLDEMEKSYLFQKKRELDISDEEYEALIENGRKNNLQVPESEDDRLAQLIDMIDVAMIDGSLDAQEYALIVMVGEILDFNLAEVNMMFKLSFGIIPEDYFRESKKLDISNFLENAREIRNELLQIA